ncbi:PQQ-binding-like beta-propeller repeat protein [Umboniibacter marinipuniceus]|uniref:Putative pyrroloquinoline-quinone binding quinoprotein n=1 Tax=Umboniibacter marinipuniceus TaxID=569599 RepID=A0A3M0A839_9GAMM|nr:PQQ-binding-like beta-propeller repeat protein [Umboniibacter marinipuniceus]RMA80970.1 putative pyrroloquinoline-quinone binding quinoprotein [Umboniibacter marinipuniceus]
MNKLFLGIKSHVVCLDKRDGKELWRTKLKTSTVTNVYYENDQVFAYAGGHLFCLSTLDGKIVWTNTLKGLGFSTCIIASEQQSTSVITSQVAAQQAATAATVGAGAAVAASN